MKPNLSYQEILKTIDRLRAQGLSDNDPQIKALKKDLWLYLEERNKEKSTKIVPTVTAIKTIKIEPKILNKPSLGDEAKPDNKQKYFLLGICLAIIAICYSLIKKR